MTQCRSVCMFRSIGRPRSWPTVRSLLEIVFVAQWPRWDPIELVLELDPALDLDPVLDPDLDPVLDGALDAALDPASDGALDGVGHK